MNDLDAWESDARDECEAFALLDNSVVRETRICLLCNRYECRHRCDFCGTSRPCPCDEGGEITQKESRLMAARAGQGPRRFHA